MDLQYAEIAADYRAASLVIVNAKGQTWSPAAKAFVADYPADCRVPLVKPAAHPGTVQTQISGLPDEVMFVYLADTNGSFLKPVPYLFTSTPQTYVAVLSDPIPTP